MSAVLENTQAEERSAPVGENDESPDLQASATRGALWNVLQAGGNQAASFVVFIILGRILDPRDFGLSATAYTIITAMRVVVDGGFGNAIVQKEELGEEDADTAFWTAVGLALMFTALTIAISPLLAKLFHEPRLTLIVDCLTVIYVFVALDSIQVGLLVRRLEFRLQTIRRLVASLVSAAVAVGLAIAGAGVWALVGQQIVLEGVSVVLLWSLTTWRPRRAFSRRAFRGLFAFGSRYSAMRILWYLSSSADNFLIAGFLGPVALGYYAIGYRVLTVFNNLLVVPISNVALPTFSRLQHDPEGVNRALYRSSRLSLSVALPVYVGMAVIARPLLIVLFGAKWAPSVPVLVVLTAAGVLQTQTTFLPAYMMALGRINNEFPWLTVVVTAQVIGFLIGAQFGIVAVASALSIVLLVSLLVRLTYLRGKTGIRLRGYFQGYPALLAAGGVMGGIVWCEAHLLLTGGPLALRLVIEVATGALVYPLALAVLAPRIMREAIDAVPARVRGVRFAGRADRTAPAAGDSAGGRDALASTPRPDGSRPSDVGSPTSSLS